MLGTYVLIVSPVIGHASAHHTLITPWAPERKQHHSDTVQGNGACGRSRKQVWDYSGEKTVAHLCCMSPLVVTVMNAWESSMASKNSASSFSSLASPSWDRSTPTATNTGYLIFDGIYDICFTHYKLRPQNMKISTKNKHCIITNLVS